VFAAVFDALGVRPRWLIDEGVLKGREGVFEDRDGLRETTPVLIGMDSIAESLFEARVDAAGSATAT
jgi:hypothetical protein